jgi:hypothetical protein
MIYLAFPFSVQKEYNLTYSFKKYNRKGSQINIIIISSEPNTNFQIAIQVNDTHFIVTPKNTIAKKSFRKWFEKSFKEPEFNEAEFLKLQALISNNKYFELVPDRKQSYKEFLAIRFSLSWYNAIGSSPDLPIRPDKHFDLLKDWYLQIWNIAKSAKEKTIDYTPETLNIFEIEIINDKIFEIDKKYFPELLPAGTPNSANRMPYISEDEKVTNRAFKKWLNERKVSLEQNPSGKVGDNYTNAIWFKVGLHFATGKIAKLLLKHSNNYTAIAKEMGNKNFRPYISESVANTNKTDKNIFSNSIKLKKILGHCITNNIQVTDEFKRLIPSE